MSSTETRHSNAKRSAVWMRWSRRLVLAAVGATVVGMLVLAWMPEPVPVDLVAVHRDVLRVTVEEDGRTRVQDRFVVSAPLTGNLARLEFHAGDIVHEGDVLARVVPLPPPLLDARTRAEAQGRALAASAQQRQAQSAIERARAALELSEREAIRLRHLNQQGGATDQALDRAEMELHSNREALSSARFASRVARHEVEVARAALQRFERNAPTEQLEVAAPVDGVVLRVMQESGGAVQAGTPLLEIGNPEALEIIIDVLTTDAVRIEPGAKVRIERWGGDSILEGHVRMVEPSAFTRISALGVEEQRVNIVVDLDSPREQWSQLGDGFRVEATVIVQEIEDAIVVPSTAVFRDGESWTVYLARDGRAKRTPIEVGARNGLEVEVRSGVSEDDYVIVHPSDRVVDGVDIRTRSGATL